MVGKVNIEIRMDNEAFNVEGFEVARMLSILVGELEMSGNIADGETSLRDVNGNIVGHFRKTS